MSTVDISPWKRQKDRKLVRGVTLPRSGPSRRLKKPFIGGTILVAWLFIAPLVAQTPGDPSSAPGSSSQEAGSKEKGVLPSPQNSTVTSLTGALPSFVSGSKRDPFKSPLDKGKAEKQPEVEVIDTAPPRNRRPQGPTGWLISEIRLLGVVQGMGTKVAMVSGGGTFTYFLHEGERLYDGFIQEIGDNSVKFVREIKSKNIIIRKQEVTVSVHPAP